MKSSAPVISAVNMKIPMRAISTPFLHVQKEADFVKKLENSKGFCLVHFGDLCQSAVEKLKPKNSVMTFLQSFSL